MSKVKPPRFKSCAAGSVRGKADPAPLSHREKQAVVAVRRQKAVEGSSGRPVPDGQKIRAVPRQFDFLSRRDVEPREKHARPAGPERERRQPSIRNDSRGYRRIRRVSGREERPFRFRSGYAADPPVSARIVPAERLTALSLTAGGTRVALSGLDVPAGSEIGLERDGENLLTVRNRTTGESLYGRLAADSGDGLFLPAGTRGAVGFSADAACDVTFQTRGLYL